MQPQFDLPEDIDKDAEAALDAKGLADLEAGSTVSGEAVVRWIRSWGSADPLPSPKIGD